MIDVIVLGSGPAGLGAALYAKRAGLSVLVIERAPMSGGQILNTDEVDNYLGLPGINGFDMGTKFREHVESMGVTFVLDEIGQVECVDAGCILKGKQEGYEAKTLIIATGATHSKLGVPGEEELTGMGVSYCATCDGAFFRNREVAVIGGGDVAVEDAIYLAALCKKVYLIHRRDSLRAADSLQERLMRLDNVEIIWNHTVQSIEGTDCVESLVIKSVGSDARRTLFVEGVFIAVGTTPETDMFQGIVDRDEKGYICAFEDGITSKPGIFVAGDARSKKLRQVITAVSDGAHAATSAWEYIRNH